MDAPTVLAVSLPLVAASAIGLHVAWQRRRAAALFRDFERRWNGRAGLIVEGRVWRAGDRRRAMIALAADRIAVRAERSGEDIEVPLGLLRAGGVRERPDGTRLLDLSLPGDRFFLQVAPGFVAELGDRLAGGRR